MQKLVRILLPFSAFTFFLYFNLQFLNDILAQQHVESITLQILLMALAIFISFASSLAVLTLLNNGTNENT